jgi:hypothetical protein
VSERNTPLDANATGAASETYRADGRERNANRARKSSYRPPPARTLTCPHCEQSFTAKHGNKQYCSVSCQRAAAWRRAHPAKTAQTYTCLHCGGAFTSMSDGALYCSDSHRVSAHRLERAALIQAAANQLRTEVSVIEDYADRHGLRVLRAAMREYGRKQREAAQS